MSLSAPRTIFGVHSFAFFDRTTKIPYGIVKLLGSVSVAQNGSFVDLYGGSSRYPWDSEAGTLDATITVNVKEFHSVLFQRALGASVTNNAAEASGNVGTLTNQKGSSVMNASTGIASVGVISGSEADLKDGLYVIEALSSTTVAIYCLSDVDFDTGTDKEFAGDTMKIVSAAQTITSGDDTAITGFGFQLNGGSGTIGMTVGDTAYFYVRKINGGSDLITVGQSTQSFTEFGCLWTAQKKANGEVFEILVPRAKAIGLPLTLTEQAWATGEIQMKALKDATENAVFKIRNIKAAS